MVTALMLAQGFSEKGSQKFLPWDDLMSKMLDDVIRHAAARGHPFKLAYCGDGATYDFAYTAVEVKVAVRIIQKRLDAVGSTMPIETIKFSFLGDKAEAATTLRTADMFYFKGFGGGVKQLFPVFGGWTGDTTTEMCELVELFKRRLMEPQPEQQRCSLLLVAVCGAAILLGTHYPGQARIKTLSVLGDVHIQYDACKNIADVRNSNNADVIQLVNGIANVIRFQNGEVEVSTCCVAKSHHWTYDPFKTVHTAHLQRLIEIHSRKWRVYCWCMGETWDIENVSTWACRADGAWLFPAPVKASVVVSVIRESFKESLARDQFFLAEDGARMLN
jgi:hypothetical protein